MADYILEMKNITKLYPGVKALDNVNLKVERGEIHALVGENGAGKSTLMNVLSGTITLRGIHRRYCVLMEKFVSSIIFTTVRTKKW